MCVLAASRDGAKSKPSGQLGQREPRFVPQPRPLAVSESPGALVPAWDYKYSTACKCDVLSFLKNYKKKNAWEQMHEHFWEEGFVQFFFSPNYIVIFFGKKKKNTRASLPALDSEGSISFPVKASNPEKEFESEVSEKCSRKKKTPANC